MALPSPSADSRQDLVFWAGDYAPNRQTPSESRRTPEEDYDENLEDRKVKKEGEDDIRLRQYPSMYVQLLEEMINTVILHESHLISKVEKEFIKDYTKLTYAARYLLVRLCLRKEGKWHRLSDLKYEKELGSTGVILDAMNELCGCILTQPPVSPYASGTKRTGDNEMPGIPKAKKTKIASLPPKFQQKLSYKKVKRETPMGVRVKEEPTVIDLTSDGGMDVDQGIPAPPPIAPLPLSSALLAASQSVESASIMADTFFTSTIGPVKFEKETIKPVASSSKVKLEDMEFPQCAVTTEHLVKVEASDMLPQTLERVEPLLPSSFEKRLETLSTGTEDLSFFAYNRSHSDVDLHELLGVLSGDELKAICKERKLKKGSVEAMIEAIILSAGSQAVLDRGLVVRKPAALLKAKLLNLVVKVIEINPSVLRFFRRLDLIYFRRTQVTDKIMTVSILKAAKLRNYVPYEFKRTEDIWTTRSALLSYEAALKLEACMEEILNGSSTPAISVLKVALGLVTNTTESTSEAPDATQSPSIKNRPSVRTPASQKKAQTARHVKGKTKDNTNGIPRESSRITNAREVKAIFEMVYPEWERQVKMYQGAPCVRPGMERFESGYVLTRIVWKGCHALASLGEHARELEVIEALLAQRRWRRGRRGGWHDRRALILMKHRPKVEETWQLAMKAVMEALEDNDTHLIYRPKLERRLTTLEKKLKIPESDWHTCEGAQLKAPERTIIGSRIRERTASLSLDGIYRPIKPLPVNQGILKAQEGSLTMTKRGRGHEAADIALSDSTTIKGEKRTGKTIWQGRDDEQVNVETLALQWYEDNEEYRGFHCEGRILRALYAVLFWDVIFAEVDGAFETGFQSAPLDIADESFYYTRKELIDERLKALKENPQEATRLIQSVYDRHSEKKPWCVGFRWDDWQKEDLLEIVECIGGKALALICHIFSEDYAKRGSGVPDLFLWNANAGCCKFVEVKGPGDTLRENQKVWIDIMVRNGISVEKCNVIDARDEEEAENQKAAKREKKRKFVATQVISDGSEEPESEGY